MAFSVNDGIYKRYKDGDGVCRDSSLLVMKYLMVVSQSQSE